ncbi:MAG TPA: SAM-dependent methyltransferase [Hellea balneolensis]|uniref:SAM-dependent methyltransferase n=1 Tax=Hellea balneolensis TaxID=287478 RepID=A0A7C3GDN5_9PROT|nr:SAM-dependent methyltransferase [Hellea balneolensis]
MKSLKQRIIKHIEQTGPMSVASYMGWSLLDPTQGYYPTRDPLGVDGDFITAPEISQMFGELLGLWLLHAWKNMGSPNPVHLVEFGPGRGVMMSDILRTAKLDPDFIKALNLYLIETSSALEAKQAEQLGNSPVSVHWVQGLQDVPQGPVLIVANEYLDCLPIRQFIMKDRFKGLEGWHERKIDLDPQSPDNLVFTVSSDPISATDHIFIPPDTPEAKDGDLLEINPGTHQIVEELRLRSQNAPCVTLFIDYGPDETEFGDTFQALQKHVKTNPLDTPGEADLTARVNFSALRHHAQEAGLQTIGPSPQGQFLSRMGIEVRAVSLSKSSPKAKEKIARQLHRLTDVDQMGHLFKAVCIQSPGLPEPLGFRSQS